MIFSLLKLLLGEHKAWSYRLEGYREPTLQQKKLKDNTATKRTKAKQDKKFRIER